MSWAKDIEDLEFLLEQEALGDFEREAFADMKMGLVTNQRQALSEKQRAWVDQVAERYRPTYENAWSAGKVPRGREVSTPAALQNLPKRPPPRKPIE